MRDVMRALVYGGAAVGLWLMGTSAYAYWRPGTLERGAILATTLLVGVVALAVVIGVAGMAVSDAVRRVRGRRWPWAG